MKIEPRNSQSSFSILNRVTLGKYVYCLVDPRDKKVFYVGQAKTKARLKDHFKEAENYFSQTLKPGHYSPHLLRINEIWAANEEVEWHIIASNLQDQKALDAVEAAIIDLLRISQNGPALNKIKGKHSTFLDQEGLVSISAQPVNPSINLPFVFIFPIQNQLANGLTPYEATRKAWYVKKEYREKTGAVAVGLSGNISKGVFQIGNWVNHDKKHQFNKVDLESDILDQLLEKHWGKIISGVGYWQRGNYLIIEFNGKGEFRYIRGNPDDKTWFPL
jgi:hypothetical protein